MAYQDERIYRKGLTAISEGNILHLCSIEPATYNDAVNNSFANKFNPSFSAITDGSNGSRQRQIQGFTDGVATVADQATAWALVDTTASRLLLADALEAPINLVLGTAVSLSTITVSVEPPSGITMTPILDFGLDVATGNSEEFRLFPSVPADYAGASTGILASFLNPVINTAIVQNGGYQVSLEEFTIPNATADGTVAGFAFLDNTNLRILISGTVATSQPVTTDRAISVG